ncbi:MAG: HlyD family efflux transporter periplasmic adaptor subunit [Candidatus Parabeggiatoa sp.]|nr:HlyD family efflux transporter periplasmic adaptor subunit [Candidatus Parabeggiatoa sp.]
MNNQATHEPIDSDILNQYRQLQTAYYQLEDDKLALENQLKKLKRRRKLIVILLVITGLGGSGYFWSEDFWSEELTAYVLGFWNTQEAKEETTDNIIVVKQETLQTKLSITGKIEPLNQMEILSPLEGMVKEKHFQYGELTKKDRVLLVIDTTQEEVKYREAHAAYIKAQTEVKKLRDWKNSPEVARARRNLTKAQYGLKTTQRELEEIRRLLKKGIVATSELEKIEESDRNQKLDYQSVIEELEIVLEQGSKENLRISELNRKNAQFKMQEMEERIKNAKVVSPIDGVVLLPINTKEDAPTEIQHGSFVKQDQVLFTIANLQGFTIKSKVDEIDILKLKIGQKVTITGDAFEDITLEGAIKHISSQADKENVQEGMPSRFAVTIAVSKLTDEQKKRLLLGMSTDMEVLLSEKKDALVVPFEAITIDKKEQAWVTKLDKETGEPQKVQVKIGTTTIETVEILEGVEVGDKLLPEVLPSGE